MSELVDTSALILGTRDERVRPWLIDAVAKDDVILCDIVALEFLMGARTADDYARLELALAGFRWAETVPADWRRAREVHRALAGQGAGHQRSVRIPDLLIAAIGEREGLSVAHYDEDYDRIAAITGQPTRWVLPRGTA
ncbi:MAG TPA: PIN domain-containing protein [Candidatus Limnocylindrales bacterium]